MAADLRPLGERARHAARYYPTGDSDGLSHSGGPVVSESQGGDDRPAVEKGEDEEEPEVIVLEEAEEEAHVGLQDSNCQHSHFLTCQGRMTCPRYTVFRYRVDMTRWHDRHA